MDDQKYGPNTLLSPFQSWDPELQNGDRLAGFAFPQLLPEKKREELARRYEGKFFPDKKRLKEWVQQKIAIDAQL